MLIAMTASNVLIQTPALLIDALIRLIVFHQRIHEGMHAIVANNLAKVHASLPRQCHLVMVLNANCVLHVLMSAILLASLYKPLTLHAVS